MKKHILRSVALVILAQGLVSPPLDAADTVAVVPVVDNIYMLEGQGGNIGLFLGDDGGFMIDDQFAPLSGEILAAIASLGGGAPKFLLNTHFHGDHTGGNENFGKGGAVIVAQDKVRERLSGEQVNELLNFTTPASPKDALPVITFADEVRFHWNGDTLEIFHVDNAHTDGDSIVHFIRANVIHTGDVVFGGRFPFIDASAGGTIDGMISATQKILRLADADTRIIPGHGPLMRKADVERYLEMLEISRSRIAALKDAGESLQSAVDSKPFRDLEGQWSSALVDGDLWVKIVYLTL